MLLESLIIVLVQIASAHDGDTVTTANKVHVRLLEIDCPELKQPYGVEARDFTISKVVGKVVSIDVKGKDKYQRTLGTVLLDQGTLNEALVKEGLAWSYNSKHMKPLETEARAEHKGLWQDPNPTPPWEFRKQLKTKPLFTNWSNLDI